MPFSEFSFRSLSFWRGVILQFENQVAHDHSLVCNLSAATMEVIALLKIVGTTLKIVKEIWEGAQWMQRVHETYCNGDKTLQSIALECNIYGESIKAIGQWLKRNQAEKDLLRQMRTTYNALTLVQVSMANVLLDLKKFKAKGSSKSTTKDTRLAREKENILMFKHFMMNKAKQQWFADIMRGHLTELRAHAAILHMCLGVIELAGVTTNRKAAAPEKLEARTGNLERRLLLRHFIRKALEIKRNETAGYSGRADAGQSSKTPKEDTQESPQKLTFYDVVQLARQQAFAEKTRRSNEDLIDFSDNVQPPLSPTPLTSNDIALIDSSIPTSSDPAFQSLLGMPELDSNPFMTNNRATVAELDSGSSLHRQSVDLHGLVELNSMPITNSQSALVELDATPPSRSHPQDLMRLAELDASRADSHDQPGLEIVVANKMPLANKSDTVESSRFTNYPATIDPTKPIQPPDTTLLDREDPLDDAVDDNKSVASSAAPSIFSHSSSLTSATGCSLSPITEEELQARKFSAQAEQKM